LFLHLEAWVSVGCVIPHVKGYNSKGLVIQKNECIKNQAAFIGSKSSYPLVFPILDYDVNSDSSPPHSAVKRTVEFMGVHVSYPQYVRLKAIQKEVIKMDQGGRKQQL
jgi:hypothetical protein